MSARADLDLGIIPLRVPARNPLDALPLWEAAKQDDDALAAAERARNLAIQAAHDHANEQWKQTAYAEIVSCARKYATFTSDTVWAGLKGSTPKTHNKSALGPLFLIAARKGLIRRTKEYVPSTSTKHHREIAEWASLVLDEGAV